MENFWAIIAAFSIPSLISGFAMWQIKRVIVKSEDRKIEREQSRERHETMLLEITYASVNLGEALAIAARDGRCNGEIKAALDCAKEVKARQKKYLNEMAIKHIY